MMKRDNLICRFLGHDHNHGRSEIIARSVTGEDVDVALIKYCKRCGHRILADGIHHHHPKEIAYNMSKDALKVAFPSWSDD